MSKLVLSLFITGRTPSSEQAIANLQRICADRPPGNCEISVIDVLEKPDVAEDRRILATPTLIREAPLPARRVIGDLSDLKKVVRALDLQPAQQYDRQETSDA